METAGHELLYLFFELTKRCNLSCLHCGSDCLSESRGPELGLAEWTSIARSVAGDFRPKPFIVLTGGEPLVLDWVEELGAELARLGLGWGLVTNGLELTESRLAALSTSGIGSVTVSLDGLEASHDALRGREGAWFSALGAVRVLGGSRLPIKDVVTCVHSGNLGELDALAELLIDAGIGSWRLFRIFRKGRALARPELSLDREGYLRMVDWIVARRPGLSLRGLELSLSCDGYLPVALEAGARAAPSFCRSGINIASVLCDGSVTGCPNNDRGFIQGRIGGKRLFELWEEGFAPFRDRSWLRNTACATCGASKRCRGGSFHDWSPGARASAQCWMTL
jgi:radical SAM protein with 4Fe4S-binding SPASM domain